MARFVQSVMILCGGMLMGICLASFHKASLVVVMSTPPPPILLPNSIAPHCPLPPNSMPLTLRLSQQQHAFDLVVWNDGDFLTNTLQQTGIWEIADISSMARLADTTIPNNSTVFWDIGANVGYYSFLFSSAGYTVVALEPETQNAELFRASLCRNPHLANKITLLPLAATSPDNTNSHCRLVAHARARRMRPYLHLSPKLECVDHSPATTTSTCTRRDTLCQLSVPTTTLDDLVQQQQYPLPDILKLDVEGHEYSVLLGATGILGATQLIQYENKDGRNTENIASRLQSRGYTIGTRRGHDSNTVAYLYAKP